MTARPIPVLLAAVLALSGCAHVSEGSDPQAMLERVVRDACMPFVVDGATTDQVGQTLGGWWGREWPDPFSPVPGTDFKRGGFTLTVDDGRGARQMNGALYPDPIRSCYVWTPRQDPEPLVATVRAAIANRPELVPIPSEPHPTVRTLACGRSGPHVLVVQVRAVADDRSGVIIRESRTPVPGCA